MSSISVVDKLDILNQENNTQFAEYEEEAIVSLALDHPDLFMSAARFMKPDMFARLEVRMIIAEILNSYDEFSVIPTRKLLRSRLERYITVDDKFEEIFRIVDRQSEPREVPIIKDTLLKWSRTRAFGLLYSEEAVAAYHRGDFTYLEEIVQNANRIADVGNNGLWFFEDYQLLFQPDIVQHKTTGFPKLDKCLNNGGPSAKEVVIYMASTNVGKSILLCNTAISSIKGEGSNGIVGQDVLLVTFELDTIKTAMRCLASASGIPQDDLVNHQEYVTRMMTSMQKQYNKRFAIFEMSPDECSVNHIYALIDVLKRTENWKPDVVIIDYMDLMISRNQPYNSDDYTRQKHVANEIRGLAKNENVLVFTATQTNRSGASGEEIADLKSAAESFGKQFAADYIISLNQTKSDRQSEPPRLKMFIAKNRNGPKHVLIPCEIKYDTMQVTEEL